jgi:hypothetical protein
MCCRRVAPTTGIAYGAKNRADNHPGAVSVTNRATCNGTNHADGS